MGWRACVMSGRDRERERHHSNGVVIGLRAARAADWLYARVWESRVAPLLYRFRDDGLEKFSVISLDFEP